MKIQPHPHLPAASRLALLLAAATVSASAATTFFSFEDSTPQGWAVNSAGWASGFNTMAVASEHATDGSKSLQIDFIGQFYKWGGLAESYANPSFLEAIKPGGKLFADVFIPAGNEGIAELGFVIQQPDVTGDKGWQQVWFRIGGATGSFTIELPFERLGSGPVNLHLGQNATVDQPFTLFLDNLRFEPAPPVGPAPITWQTFEDGTTQGWTVNPADQGLTTVANASENATEGSKALKVTFQGSDYKWGAYHLDIVEPALLAAIQHGGKFLFDLTVPADSSGFQNLGFAFQQAGVAGTLGWQQIWYGVNGQTGTFTLELPFQRTGTGAVTFHLGQNAPAGKAYPVYLDNLRVVPNLPPGQGLALTTTSTLFSFEAGTAEGFEVNSQGWGLAFTTLESAEGNATHGVQSLRATFPTGAFKWGAYANNVTRPEVLSALSESGTLLVDVFVPQSVTTVQHLGVALSQPGAASPKDWQQAWFFVGGQTGRFTIEVPFTRETDKAINLNLGQNSAGDTEAEVYFDNFRVVTSEIVGATVGTAKALPTDSAGKVKLEFTGDLESAEAATGPFLPVVEATSPWVVDLAETGPHQFFRAQGQPLVYFDDDLEGANAGWVAKYVSGATSAPAWELGAPAYPDEVTFAHSGSRVWATSLATPYADGVVVALTSPVINLEGATTGARLAFYDLLDAGGTEGDGDKAEVFVRSENGTVLTGAETPIWTGSRSSAGPYFFQRRVVDLPAVAPGKKVKLEFRLTSDATGAGLQKGWLVDDVKVYAQP
jgi:hypothetical protein